MFAEPGESEDVMLAVDKLERSEEPLAGRVCSAGDVNEECSFAWTGVSHMVGVSVVLWGISLPAPSRFVLRVRPAPAGECCRFWVRCGSGEWYRLVSIVGVKA